VVPSFPEIFFARPRHRNYKRDVCTTLAPTVRRHRAAVDFPRRRDGRPSETDEHESDLSMNDKTAYDTTNGTVGTTTQEIVEF